MSYEYSDATREGELWALPDVEVFFADDIRGDDGNLLESGYYFVFGLPGCLPDSEASGPYVTEGEALAAAREMAGCCPHGAPEGKVCEECPAPVLWVLESSGRDYVCYSRETRDGFGFTPDARRAAAWNTEDAAKAFRTSRGLEGFRVVRLGDDDARKWGCIGEGC